jgi:hypothetical protein
VPAPAWKAAAGMSRLAQRLLRFMVYNVVPLANGDVFVTFDKTAGIIRDGRYMALPGLVRPCRVMRSGCAVDRHGDLYFGEYLANDERGEMRIYRLAAGADNLDVAYTFPAGTIKHIHGIYLDKFTDRLVCLSGDHPHECRIIVSRDGFDTIEDIGGGDETWRAVSMLFDKDSFYYGTDAEFRDNEIYSVNRGSLERKSLGKVSGTVFYCKQVGDDMFFATTAENAPSQKENVAAIYRVDADGNCSELVRYEKDRWNGTYFMFGMIHFPAPDVINDRLYYNLVGVSGDNHSFCVERNN